MTPGLETPEERRRFTIYLVSQKMAYMILSYASLDEETVWQKEWDDYRSQLTGEDLSIAVEAFDTRMEELNNGQ